MPLDPKDFLAQLDAMMIKPKNGIMTQTGNNYIPSPIDWANAVVAGTPGSAQKKGLQTKIKNEQKKLTEAGLDLPSMEHDKPWYMDVLDFIDRGRSAIVNPLADVATNGFHKSNIIDDILNGLSGKESHSFQEVIDNSWMKNIPGINQKVDDILSFTPMYKGAKELARLVAPENVQEKEDIMNNLSLGGFVGDVALDPTIYLTLGGGSAIKAGSKAAKNAAKASAKELGVKVGEDVFQSVGNNYATEFANRYKSMNDIDPYLIDELAQIKGSEVNKGINDAAKAARAKAQNALINFDLPFTDITKQFGSKPEFMKIKDGLIGATQVGKAKILLDELGLDDKGTKTLLDKSFGKSSLNDLSIQEFDELMNRMGKVEKAPGFESEILQKTLKFDKPPRLKKDLVKWLAENLPKWDASFNWTAKEINKTFNASDVKDMANELLQVTSPLKSETAMKSVVKEANPLSQFDQSKFVKDMGGKSDIGKVLDKAFSGIKARTSGSKDEVVNQAAGKIQDADNKVYGHSIQMNRDLKSLKKAMKGLNDSEKRAIDYILENKAPEGKAVEDFIRSGKLEQVKKVAGMMKELYTKLGQLDLQAGTISGLRQNYAHHAIKGNETILSELLSNPKVSKYMGRSSTNRAGLERKSFETMADLDNAVKALEDSLADPKADVAKITEQIEQLQNLFHRDPLEAISKRYNQSIKSRAYKELGDSLEKDGLIVKTGKPIPKADLGNYEHLDEKSLQDNRSIINQLGLKKGDRIHKEVLEGLERADQLFTDKGMNQFFRLFESTIGVWKGLVTVNVPSHHLFNTIGNIANTMLAGVNLSSYEKAGQILTGKGDRKIYQLALDHGILNQGIASDLGMLFEKQADTLSKAEKIVYNNPLAKTMNTAGNFSDNMSRLALFIHMYEKTGSDRIAAQQVRKYLFNYREMTRGDRSIRAFAPFWNWTKNNIPLQLMEFARQPRYYATFQKLREQFNEDQPEDMIPEYAKDEYIKVPGMEDTLANPRLPLQDLGKNPADIISGSLTPLAKVPIELLMNKKFFNNAPIDDTYDEVNGYDPAKLEEYAADQLGLVGRAYKNHAMNDTPALDTFLQSLFGKPIKVDREKQDMSNLYRQLEILTNARKRAERNGLIQ